MKRKNPLRAGFILIPFYFGITSGVLTMLIVWKGGTFSPISIVLAYKARGRGDTLDTTSYCT
jgi:hypothetical protein